jgi:hypothetical protein
MKILSLGITQHFTNEVERLLNLAISIGLPSFDDDCYSYHVACSRYVKQEVFVGIRSY